MTDSSLRPQQISEADPHANTIDSAITATAPNIEDPDEVNEFDQITIYFYLVYFHTYSIMFII